MSRLQYTIITHKDKKLFITIPEEHDGIDSGFYQIGKNFKKYNQYHKDIDSYKIPVNYSLNRYSDWFDITHRGNPIKAKSDNWHETADSWVITYKNQVFEYYTGLGYRKPILSLWHNQIVEYKQIKKVGVNNYNLSLFLQYSKPSCPDLAGVIKSLLDDCYFGELSFDDFCAELGYSNDSLKNFDTYRACQENRNKVSKLGLNIDELREALEDY